MYTIKQKIAKRFSRAAEHYNQAASIQQQVGTKLMSLAPDIAKKNPSILDIGCGTGYLNESIKHRYSNAKIIGLDLSHSMLTQLYLDRTTHSAQAICADFDALPFPNQSIDGIFSNMALHWSPDLFYTLHELKNVLKKHGILAFSIPCLGTLKELPQINPLPNKNEIKLTLKQLNFSIQTEHQETFVDYFESALSAIHSIKQTGSSQKIAPHHQASSSRQHLYHLLDHLEKQRTAHSAIPLSYDIYFAVCQKEER